MSEATGDLITRVYSNFRGVDFRGDEINLVRSPDSLNVWKDYKEIESIRTRPGMEKVINLSNPVYGIFFYKDKMLAHVGDSLGELSGNTEEVYFTPLCNGLEETVSYGFVFEDVFYFKNGKHYMQYDGMGMQEVEGYVPTTSIGRKPSGGGTIYEDVNMLTRKRINTFVGDNASVDYFLDAQNIDSDFYSQVKVTVNGETVSGFTVDHKAGKVTFTKAPETPKTDGQDNVSIEFCKTVDGYRDTILKCSLVTVFDNRVFVSGNPDWPNYVYHCSLNDPTYFSDLDYYKEGIDDAKVKGMVAGNNALWVFREPTVEGTTVFYHTPTIDDEYGKIYPSTHSSASIGCVGKAVNFNDDIVFFSTRGMEGISGDVTTEQAVAHRSCLVDRRMTAENGYANMVLAEWEGYLLVFIGNKAYLADSRAMFTVDNHAEYEWFYWEMEKPINYATTKDGILYLATDDGIYTLTDNTCDLESYWTTPKDKFKYPHMQKTTNKRGCVAEATGDITVYAKTEKTAFELIGEYENVTDYFVSRIKKKKFKDIQLKFHSNTRFSLETVSLECFIGAYVKR